jgi:hypothetical protein
MRPAPWRSRRTRIAQQTTHKFRLLVAFEAATAFGIAAFLREGETLLLRQRGSVELGERMRA